MGSVTVGNLPVDPVNGGGNGSSGGHNGGGGAGDDPSRRAQRIQIVATSQLAGAETTDPNSVNRDGLRNIKIQTEAVGQVFDQSKLVAFATVESKGTAYLEVARLEKLLKRDGGSRWEAMKSYSGSASDVDLAMEIVNVAATLPTGRYLSQTDSEHVACRDYKKGRLRVAVSDAGNGWVVTAHPERYKE